MALALFAGIRVSDLGRAREWYERLLGSEPEPGLRRLVNIVVVGIRHHADDLGCARLRPRWKRQDPADRIGAPKHGPGQRLVHDRHGRAAPAVAGLKVPAGDGPDSHRLEESGTDDVEERLHARPVRGQDRSAIRPAA